MAKIIRKLDTGEEVKGFELDSEMKLEFDFEGKALKDDEIEMIGSTGAIDRDGEVINPKGIDLKAFKKNPVILAQHMYSRPAIGKATRIKVTDGKLMFKIQFPEEGVNPEADVYRKLYKSGFMNASSIGFVPKEWTDGDGKKAPYRTYDKSELLELSLVSVPANSEALLTTRSAVTKGIITEDEAKLIEPEEKQEKNADINYIVSSEHELIHNTLNSNIKAMTDKLIFIEGFISGLQKTVEVETQKSYIADLLSGRAPKGTENDTESNDVKDVKNIFGKD